MRGEHFHGVLRSSSAFSAELQNGHRKKYIYTHMKDCEWHTAQSPVTKPPLICEQYPQPEIRANTSPESIPPSSNRGILGGPLARHAGGAGRSERPLSNGNEVSWPARRQASLGWCPRRAPRAAGAQLRASGSHRWVRAPGALSAHECVTQREPQRASERAEADPALRRLTPSPARLAVFT